MSPISTKTKVVKKVASPKKAPVALPEKTQDLGRELRGLIVSDKMTKTRVVAITRLVLNKKYGKRFKVTKKYKVHDDTNATVAGQTVIIRETRPISKDKRWIIVTSS